MYASTLNHFGAVIMSMSLKERIKEAVDDAIAKGKTKAQIARTAGVSAGALTQWLTGDTKSLKMESADGLQNATGYLAHWLVYGKGPKKAENAPSPMQWSPQAVAIAEQIDWITDSIPRTAAWLDASQVLQNHYRRWKRGDNGDGDKPLPPAPSDTPALPRKPRKRRA